MIDEAETVDLELELLQVRPGVVHRDAARIGGALAFHLGRTGSARIGVNFGAVVDDVVDGGLDGLRRGVEFGQCGHGCLLMLKRI
jgi:hypothetical protein